MLRLVFCFVLTVQSVLGVGSGQYSCNSDKSFTLVYTWDDTGSTDPYTRLVLKGTTGAGCEIVRTGTEATTTLQIADLSASSCTGFTFTYSNAGSTSTATGIVIYLTKLSDRVEVTDLTFPSTDCDFLAPTQQVVVTAQALVPGGDPTGTGTVAAHTETIILDLVDPTGLDTPVWACTLGADLKIRLALTKSATADGIHALACRARNQAAQVGSVSLDLLTDSCSAAVVSMGGAKGFKKDTTTSFTDTATKDFYIFEDTFKCFAFDPSAELYIECDVTFCSTTSTYCDGDGAGDTCTHKAVAPGARKRRAVTNSTNSIPRTAGVTILVGNYPASSTSSPKQQDCSAGFLHQTTFIVTVTILAVMLVLSMGATVYVSKKSRGASSNPPPYLAKGADNPAF